jgi:hypothetical protein
VSEVSARSALRVSRTGLPFSALFATASISRFASIASAIAFRTLGAVGRRGRSPRLARRMGGIEREVDGRGRARDLAQRQPRGGTGSRAVVALGRGDPIAADEALVARLQRRQAPGRTRCAIDVICSATVIWSATTIAEPRWGWCRDGRHADRGSHGGRRRGVWGAVAAAQEIGGPVALKADFAAPAHPIEIDAALLGLEGESALRSGWRELQRRVHTAGRQWTGAIVQPLVAPGADALVGTFNDPDLGPVIAVGLGGHQAGLAETVAFRLPPATDVEADELIDASTGVATQLDGFRGAAPLAREALRELILRFALLLAEVPEIVEADLNRSAARPTAASCSTCDCASSTGARSNASRRGNGDHRDDQRPADPRRGLQAARQQTDISTPLTGPRGGASRTRPPVTATMPTRRARGPARDPARRRPGGCVGACSADRRASDLGTSWTA